MGSGQRFSRIIISNRIFTDTITVIKKNYNPIKTIFTKEAKKMYRIQLYEIKS